LGSFLWFQYPLFLNVVAYYYYYYYQIFPVVTSIAFYFFLATANGVFAPTSNDEDDEDIVASRIPAVQLTASDKWRLMKPMLLKYMLPLLYLSSELWVFCGSTSGVYFLNLELICIVRVYYYSGILPVSLILLL